MIAQSNKQVQFHYPYGPVALKNRSALKTFIAGIFKKEKKRLELAQYIFCTDEYLLGINQQFLKHNTYTDIITFPFSLPGEPVVSDIYISIDRVKENADKYSVSFAEELHRVIFHGALHLCGFKDKTEAEAKKMRLKESYYLSLYVPRNTVSQGNRMH